MSEEKQTVIDLPLTKEQEEQKRVNEVVTDFKESIEAVCTEFNVSMIGGAFLSKENLPVLLKFNGDNLNQLEETGLRTILQNNLRG